MVASWKVKLEKLKKYIDDNDKRPSSTDTNPEIKSLATWIRRQKECYDINIKKSKNIMKTLEIHSLWTETINDPKYKEYLYIDLIEKWKQTLILVKNFMDAHKKSPCNRDKNNKIKSLGNWFNNQKQNYNDNIIKCKNINFQKYMFYGETLSMIQNTKNIYMICKKDGLII